MKIFIFYVTFLENNCLEYQRGLPALGATCLI